MSARSTYDITPEMGRELKALARKPDSDIDVSSDMPEVLDWQRAMVGKFYRPIKQPVSIRLDADVLAWFRAKKQYQTTINKALREYMEHHAAPGKKRRA